ncbi:phage tail protein [Mannheimia pernigra]|uniref:phage tail protein n=1 Tax=Mannheimia pernigra TaxID=111844 RepID=UPI001EE323CE|nr:phage tail protein [Mannheimia pernigra]
MRIYGAKGGGGGHTPIEAPETGRSKQIVNIVELLCEGEIEGLADGFKSIYLDKTQVQNEDGSYNFNNVSGQLNVGTQDQDVLDGYDSSQNEVNVGVEVKKKNGAIARTITDERISRLRLTLGVRSLFHQNDQGDTNTSRVSLKITIGTQQHTHTFDGKYSSQYLESVVFDRLPSVPFNVSVERLTDDSKSQRLQNSTIWSSYTEIIDTEFTYPNSVVGGISFDSEYFNSIPTRNYLIKAKKVKVPSNYDPIARTYNGFWDGTFKIAWTDNPAWEIYDLAPILSKMLGVEISFDKWALYDVSRYCDQLVPDGMGGQEPRFTCHVWLTEVKSAYDLLNDFCSVFRAIPIWTGSEVSVIIDRPRDPVWTYTNANVVGGFERSYSARKSRHNAVQVTYSDKKNGYERAIEYVSDDEEIKKHGLNLSQVTAFGCTSRGQAHRTGKWILETEKREKETITFTVGREGLMHLPGDIIRVADSHYAGTEIGGRVLAINGQKVTLDREITIDNASYFTYINAEATHSTIKIQSVNGTEITLSSTPTGLEVYGVWSLSTQQITSGLYRSISIVENADGTNTITALQHEPQKEAIVDESAIFEPLPATTHYSLLPVTSPEIGVDGSGVILNFSAPTFVGQGLRYQVKLFRNDKFYQLYDDLKEPNLAFANLPNGDYVAEIRAKDGQGRLSDAVSKTFNINFVVSELVALPKIFGIGLSWKNPIYAPPNSAIEIWVSKQNRFETARKLVSLAYPTNSYTYDGLEVTSTYYFWLRMVDNINSTAGQWTEAVEGVPEQGGDKIVGYLQGKITESTLGRELIQSLQNNVDNSVALEAKARTAAVAAEANARMQMTNDVNANITAARQQIASAIQDIGVLQQSEHTKTQEITNLTQKVGRQTADVRELAITTSDLSQKYGQIKSVTDNAASEITTIKQAQLDQANNVERLTSRFDNVMSSQNLLSDTLNKTTTAFLLGVYPIGRTLSEGQKVIIKATTAPAQRVLIYNSSPRGVNRIGEIMADGTPNELDWVVGNGGNDNLHIYRTSPRDSTTITLSDVSLTLPDNALADVVAELSEHKRTVTTQTQALTAKTTLLESNLAGKANVSALSSLDSRVTQVDGRITSEARKVEQLSNQLIGKANVSALSSLESRVTRYGSQIQRFDQITNDFNNQGRMLRGQISTLSNTVANLQNNEVHSTHTIKTEAISGGRTAIAGIALGASANARTVETSVIVMADKFAVVKNAQDNSVTPVFSVVDGKTAMNGDLIANGTILGRHLKANETITSPIINGGQIVGNTITGSTITGGTITGTTIEGGTIRGGRIEGVTGTFSGNVYAENILNDVVEYKKLNMNDPRKYKDNNSFTISPSPKKRVLYLPPTNFISDDNIVIEFSTGLKTWVNNDYRKEITTYDNRDREKGFYYSYTGVTDIWDIPANTELTVTVETGDKRPYIKGLFIFLILS